VAAVIVIGVRINATGTYPVNLLPSLLNYTF